EDVVSRFGDRRLLVQRDVRLVGAGPRRRQYGDQGDGGDGGQGSRSSHGPVLLEWAAWPAFPAEARGRVSSWYTDSMRMGGLAGGAGSGARNRRAGGRLPG